MPPLSETGLQFVFFQRSTFRKIHQNADSELINKALHKTIKKVTEDTDGMRFNTAISAMMEFVNAVYREDKGLSRPAAQKFCLILAPYAPHLAEEIWQALGNEKSLSYEPWPEYDNKLTIEDTIQLPVQVNGKVRGTLEVSKQTDKDADIKNAKLIESVSKHLEGKTIVKEIYVPGRIINFVVK